MRDVVFSTRIAEADRRRVRLAAAALGITPSEFAHRALAGELDRVAVHDPAVGRILQAAA